MMKRSLTAMLLWLVAGGSLAVAEPHAQAVVLRNVTLIDGSGRAPLQHASLLIEGDRIRAVGVDLAAPPGSRILDLSGRTIMPGLISDHSHVGLVDGVSVSPANYTRVDILRQLRQYEAYGVTTVVSLGLNRPPVFDPLRSEMHAGRTPGADLFGVDEGIGAPEGAPPARSLPVAEDQLFRPATADAARQAVDAMAADGSDLVKLWLDDLRNNVDKPPQPKMAPEIYRAVIAEAHSKGLRVAAHIYDLNDAKTLVAEGVDIIAHGVRDEPVDAAFTAALKRRHVWYIATLDLDESSYLPALDPGLLNDPVFAAGLQPALRAEFTDAAWRSKILADPATAGATRALALNEANLKILYDAGVQIGFGTDSGAAPTRIPGWAEHRELKLMVKAGLTPSEAIRVATRDAAALMHLTDRGRLEPGLRADFVVLAADPTVNIDNIDRVEAVWRGGVQASGPIETFRAEGAP